MWQWVYYALCGKKGYRLSATVPEKFSTAVKPLDKIRMVFCSVPNGCGDVFCEMGCCTGTTFCKKHFASKYLFANC